MIRRNNLNQSRLKARELASCLRHVGDLFDAAPADEQARIASQLSQDFDDAKRLMLEGLGIIDEEFAGGSA